MRSFTPSLLALLLLSAAGTASAQFTVVGNVEVLDGCVAPNYETLITADTTWPSVAGREVLMGCPVFVKDGATLTIRPGAVIRGAPRSLAASPGVRQGTPGTLVITQTGRLIAEGSATNPIVFTTAAIDNDSNGIPDPIPSTTFRRTYSSASDRFFDETPKTRVLAPLDKAGRANISLWGGVVVLGNAPTNLAFDATDKCDSAGYGKCTIEGLPTPGYNPAFATYGGLEPHDNSGRVRFVSIRHAGDQIGDANELNGLTLGGVGDGTIVENVEVYLNFDDGFEWFGGTVGGRNLAVFYVGDDSFDSDQGHTGIFQFLFGTQSFFREAVGAAAPLYGENGGSDSGTEFDGSDYRFDPNGGDPPPPLTANTMNQRVDETGGTFDTSSGTLLGTSVTPFPLQNMSVYNMTIMGVANPAAVAFPASANGGQNRTSTPRGLRLRNCYAGWIYNTIVINTGSGRGLDGNTGTSGEDGCPGFTTTDNANQALAGVAASIFSNVGATTAVGTTMLANGDAFCALGTPNQCGLNNYNGTFSGLKQADVSFPVTGDALNRLEPLANKIDPRPVTPGQVIGAYQPRGPVGNAGLSPVAYRGAFDPSPAQKLWTTGWTTLSIAGILID